VLFNSLPEQAFLQSHRERKGIAGFETNAIKAFQDTMPRLIGAYVRLSHDVDMTLAAKEIRAQAALPENRDNRLVQDITTALVGTKSETDRQLGKLPSYLEFSKNPYLPNWARTLRAATFTTTIGGNISSAFVNTTVIPVVLGSHLVARYGPVKATSAMLRAARLYTSTFGTYTREGIAPLDASGKPIGAATQEERGGFSMHNIDYTDLSKVSKGSQKVYENSRPLVEYMVATGNDNRNNYSRPADLEASNIPTLNKLANIGGFLFNHSERATRQIAAWSTYILEMEKRTKKSFDAINPKELETHGADAAKVALDTTEWVNSSSLLTTTSRYAQTGLGSIAWQFKQFSIQMAYIQGRMFHSVFGDLMGKARTSAEKEEARDMRNTLLLMSAVGGALGGVKGLPGYGVVASIYNMFAGEDEDDFNTVVAKAAGDGLYYGAIFKYLGVDITDRISLTDLIVRDKGNYRENAPYKGAIEALGGPTAGIGMRFGENFGKLLDDAPSNNQRAIEGMMFSSVGNLLKAYRFATEGYTTARGDPIVDDVHKSDIVKQMLGFNPSRFRKASDMLARNRRVVRGTQDMRKKLLDQFSVATNMGDDGYRGETIQKIVSFNAKHPEFSISGAQILQSLKTRATASAIARITGGAVVNKKALAGVLQSNAELMENSVLSEDLSDLDR